MAMSGQEPPERLGTWGEFRSVQFPTLQFSISFESVILLTRKGYIPVWTRPVWPIPALCGRKQRNFAVRLRGAPQGHVVARTFPWEVGKRGKFPNFPINQLSHFPFPFESVILLTRNHIHPFLGDARLA